MDISKQLAIKSVENSIIDILDDRSLSELNEEERKKCYDYIQTILELGVYNFKKYYGDGVQENRG